MLLKHWLPNFEKSFHPFLLLSIDTRNKKNWHCNVYFDEKDFERLNEPNSYQTPLGLLPEKSTQYDWDKFIVCSMSRSRHLILLIHVWMSIDFLKIDLSETIVRI